MERKLSKTQTLQTDIEQAAGLSGAHRGLMDRLTDEGAPQTLLSDRRLK
jgi:hypothetical protein